MNRREFLQTAVLAPSALSVSGCIAPKAANFGHRSSYATQIIKPENHNCVFVWVDTALQQIRDQRVVPPRAAYNLGLATAAGFLAANGITRTYSEPFGIGEGPASADPEVAYGVAFSMAAAEAFQQPFLFDRIAFLEQFPGSEAKSLGVEWGRTAALQVLKLRTHDGSEPSKSPYYLGRYQPRTDALRWTPTGPFYGATPGPAFPSYTRGMLPGHGQIKPWTLTRSSQFRTSGFIDAASPEFAESFDVVRRMGAADSDVRSADEAKLALFWEDGPWGVTPPGHMLYIGMQLLQDRELSFIEMARAFALLGMTQCDASICSWDIKYCFDVLRPETAIRTRATDFNNPDPRVVLQPDWQSYIPTPEFPAYTAGHSTFGAAAATMLELIIGRNKIAFSGRSPDEVLWPQLSGVTRHWTSLHHMAEENGMSRIYGGVHWHLDHIDGMQTGEAIAKQAFNNFFLPIT